MNTTGSDDSPPSSLSLSGVHLNWSDRDIIDTVQSRDSEHKNRPGEQKLLTRFTQVFLTDTQELHSSEISSRCCGRHRQVMEAGDAAQFQMHAGKCAATA